MVNVKGQGCFVAAALVHGYSLSSSTNAKLAICCANDENETANLSPISPSTERNGDENEMVNFSPFADSAADSADAGNYIIGKSSFSRKVLLMQSVSHTSGTKGETFV
ncbi:MAG: hypothetical protein ABI690_26000 [Chloroflexota bacterium]